jgi:LPS sulfotransferase NodH
VRELVRRVVPFGVRRTVWRARRNVPRIAQPLSVVASRARPPERPILILGCPRSGTTVLLEALLRSARLRSIHNEGHILWQRHHHPEDRGWDSGRLGAEDVSKREREYIYLAIRLFVRGRRFADKTPENCLRIPYLQELFPDASFVFLRRRAADNVSSLIEGWRARPRFVTYRLPEPLEGLGPMSGHQWSFVLIPGWRELRSAPLEEICARQYIACNEEVLEAREAIEPSRWHEVAYDELTAAPVETIRNLFERLNVPVDRSVEESARTLLSSPSSTTLSPPRAGKWRELNRAEVERVLPLVAPVEKRLGY